MAVITVHETNQTTLADLVVESGLKRVHILSWRDFDDSEAGGSELHAAMIAKLWSEAGIDITMRTSAVAGAAAEVTRDGCQVIRRGGRYTVFPRGAFAEATGRHGPADGILEVWNGVPWLSPLWARVPRTIMIHHVHQHMWDLVLSRNLARAGKFIETRLAPPAYRSTSIVTPSPSTQAEVVDVLGMSPNRVSVASPGIAARFSPLAGRLSPTPLIVSVGRLTKMKRFDEMIRIAAETRRTQPDLQLVIAGSGPEMSTLQKLVGQLGAGSWVRLLGRVTDAELVDLYRQAWVVASASMAEGWGMTLTEAAACGTPAVATRITGHCDSVVDGVTGLLADDSRDLAHQLGLVLSDRALRESLATKAAQRAAEMTWERCALGTFAPLAEAAILRAQERDLKV